MERLTAKCLKGSGYYMACSKTCPYDCMEDCDCEEFDNFVNRLGAIEDILGDEYDLELVQKLIQAYKEGRYIIMKEPEQAGVSRLRELAQADREGRCVVLPESYYTAEGAARKASAPAEQSERGQATAWIMQRFGQMS